MFNFTIPWIYKLETEYVHNILTHLPAGWNKRYEFYDIKKKPERLRLVIDHLGNLRIPAGYSWDGCSYKLFSFLDIWIVGVPDGVSKVRDGRPKTYYASLVHDVLYQFLDVNRDMVPKAKADKIFLELMRRDGFRWSGFYYFVVWSVGGLANVMTRWRRKFKSRRDPL